MKTLIRSHHLQRPRSTQGFILLEAILAISILSVIAVAMTAALSQLGAAASMAQREMVVMRTLDSLMTEALRMPTIQPMVNDSAPDSYGIVYQTVIEEMELEDMDGQPLPEMFRIQIRAVWQHGHTTQEEIVETFRYARLYIPAN